VICFDMFNKCQEEVLSNPGSLSLSLCLSLSFCP